MTPNERKLLCDFVGKNTKQFLLWSYNDLLHHLLCVRFTLQVGTMAGGGGAGGANNSAIFIRRDGCERWPCRRWMFDDDVALQRKTKPGENSSSGKIIYYYTSTTTTTTYYILFYFISFPSSFGPLFTKSRKKKERERKKKQFAGLFRYLNPSLEGVQPVCVYKFKKKKKKKKKSFLYFFYCNYFIFRKIKSFINRVSSYIF